ncbi:hypothetical protein NPIL_12531 [Nephila pilipes]|uniref:Uncharacterized protein n=1 Tax=Nephila pilipes TaxID=299642 RepID=A0A8X6QSJ8_NEPPI|nr:hypothetical protein NPIL_12531 [Nephila pilipes]
MGLFRYPLTQRAEEASSGRGGEVRAQKTKPNPTIKLNCDNDSEIIPRHKRRTRRLSSSDSESSHEKLDKWIWEEKENVPDLKYLELILWACEG